MKQVHFVFLCVIFCWSTASIGQQSINSYKYVIVPKQFEFQKKEDQYQLNSLTKFLFEREGYTVYWSTEAFPEDLAKNPCLGLKAKVNNKSSMLKTKVNIEMSDCYNTTIYQSEEGYSKIKEFKKSYHEAIRRAFQELDTIPYKYDPATSITRNNVVEATEVKKKEVVAAAVIVAPKKEVTVVENEAVKIENTVKSEAKVAETAIVSGAVVKTNEAKVKKVNHSIEGTYNIDMWGTCVIAKKGDGYSVIGGDSFEFATITKTSLPNMFMVKKTGFKDAQLLELDVNGNLKIDSKDGFKVYKRIH